MRIRQLACLLILLAGITVLAYSVGIIPSSISHPLGFSTHTSSFGSRGIGREGWRIPAITPIDTSYVANKSLTGFVSSVLNVFPFELTKGTILDLSLYVNHNLAATREYDLPDNYPNSILMGDPGIDVANFSDSMVGFTVSETLSPGEVLPVGTMVTVVLWASHSIWVQTDSNALGHSFESPSLGSYAPLSIFQPEIGRVAPHVVSWVVESGG